MDATTSTYANQIRARFSKWCDDRGIALPVPDEIASQIPPTAQAIEPGTSEERLNRIREWCAERKNRLGIKSEPSFPVGVKCAVGFTSLNQNRKEEVEEELLARCAGYGARKRKRIRRERTKRLHAPENRAKASATKRTRNADPKVREDRAWRRYRHIVEEDGPLDRRMRKIGSTVNAGGSYNGGIERLQVSIAEFRKPNFKTGKRAYLLPADPRVARSRAMREWNENYTLLLTSLGKPATGYLPAPSPVRSKVESQFETFVNSQLLPSVSLKYPELSDPTGSNELFVGSDGYFYAGVRDYDIDLGGSKIQEQVKGVGNLFYQANEIFSSDNERKYRSLRTQVFNLLFRYHQNLIFSRFADTELRPIYLVSATSVRAWSKDSNLLKDGNALLELLSREDERTLDYLCNFARAVFPKEFEVFERLLTVWDVATSALSDDTKIDLLDLLEIYRDELIDARNAISFWPSFRGDYCRAHGTYWSDVKKKLPRRFNPTKMQICR